MAPVTRPPLRRGRFWLGLGSGLLLVSLVLCGIMVLLTQPDVSFVTGPAWTPPARPQDVLAPGDGAAPSAGSAVTPAPQGIQVGGRAMVSDDVNRANLRRAAGYLNKPAGDVVGTVPSGAILDVLGGPQVADNLTWWQVRYRDLVGWMAETRSNGAPLLDPAP